jgi:hypothetical protein
MSITLNTLAYSQDTAPNPERMNYVGSSNTYTTRDELSLARTQPKPNGDYRGNARFEVRRTKTLTLDDDKMSDCVVKVQVSVPVGAAIADVMALVDDVGDFLISSDAQTLVENEKISGY